MQRNLHGLGHQRCKHQEEDAVGKSLRDCSDRSKRCARAVIENEDGSQQSVAGHVRHQQNFASAQHSFTLLIPEAHQAEGTQPDHFPAQIEEEQIRAINKPHKSANEHQHRGDRNA